LNIQLIFCLSFTVREHRLYNSSLRLYSGTLSPELSNSSKREQPMVNLTTIHGIELSYFTYLEAERLPTSTSSN